MKAPTYSFYRSNLIVSLSTRSDIAASFSPCTALVSHPTAWNEIGIPSSIALYCRRRVASGLISISALYALNLIPAWSATIPYFAAGVLRITNRQGGLDLRQICDMCSFTFLIIIFCQLARSYIARIRNRMSSFSSPVLCISIGKSDDFPRKLAVGISCVNYWRAGSHYFRYVVCDSTRPKCSPVSPPMGPLPAHFE